MHHWGRLSALILNKPHILLVYDMQEDARDHWGRMSALILNKPQILLVYDMQEDARD